MVSRTSLGAARTRAGRSKDSVARSALMLARVWPQFSASDSFGGHPSFAAIACSAGGSSIPSVQPRSSPFSSNQNTVSCPDEGSRYLFEGYSADIADTFLPISGGRGGVLLLHASLALDARGVR